MFFRKKRNVRNERNERNEDIGLLLFMWYCFEFSVHKDNYLNILELSRFNGKTRIAYTKQERGMQRKYLLTADFKSLSVKTETV